MIFRNFLLNIFEWEIADCCFLHDLGISTVRQITSLRPSTIDNWPCINMCCQQDLGFINWWPRFFRHPSNEIYTLSTEKYYEDLNVMTNIKRINHRQRKQLPRRTTTSLPFRRPTRRPLRSHRNHHHFSTPNDTGIINTIDNPPSSTVEAIIHEPNNGTNDDNHNTEPDENTIRTLFENCAFIDSINIPPENPYTSPPSSPPSSISPTNSIATVYEYDNAEDRHYHTSDEPYTSHTSIAYNGNSYQDDRHPSEYYYHHSDDYPDHYYDHHHSHHDDHTTHQHDQDPYYNDDDRHHAGRFDDDGDHVKDHYLDPEPYD